MIITINDLTSRKSVKLEVEAGHTVKVVVDEVIKGLKLPTDRTYRLVMGGKEIGPELFDKTLGELGITDGATLDLVPRPIGGIMLPEDKFQRRLAAEEEAMKREGIDFKRYDINSYIKFPMVTSVKYEELLVAVRYFVKFHARGFTVKKGKIEEKNEHEASLYVLRTYPYPDEQVGAPLRIFWESDIFHPNIVPGRKYGGNGLVCWKMIKEWGKTFSLITLIRGLQLLVENPNPYDPLTRYPICVQAAEFFKENPELTGAFKPELKKKGPRIVAEESY